MPAILNDWLTTGQVAELLGMSPARLSAAVWRRCFPTPAKTASGNLAWTEGDVEAARNYFAVAKSGRRPRVAVPA
jgi:predicted DNA-binding transcriptional regulator AlpA